MTRIRFRREPFFSKASSLRTRNRQAQAQSCCHGNCAALEGQGGVVFVCHGCPLTTAPITNRHVGHWSPSNRPSRIWNWPCPTDLVTNFTDFFAFAENCLEYHWNGNQEPWPRLRDLLCLVNWTNNKDDPVSLFYSFFSFLVQNRIECRLLFVPTMEFIHDSY